MKAALLVIDFINEIVHEKGKAPSCAAFVKAHDTLSKANQAIEIARRHKIPVIFVKVGFGAGYPEVPPASPVFSGAPSKAAFQLGEWGCEFHEELYYKKGDSVVVKHRISPFYATDLEAYLRAGQIDTIFISGVSTNNAVQACARDAHDRDYRVCVLDDTCGAKNEETHASALALMKDFSMIIPVAEFEAQLK